MHIVYDTLIRSLSVHHLVRSEEAMSVLIVNISRMSSFPILDCRQYEAQYKYQAPRPECLLAGQLPGSNVT